MIARSLTAALLLAGVCLAVVTPAGAQPLGTFSWQLTPYCNVIVLAATQLGSQYRLEGHDDQCGAGPRAAVTGLAVPNPDGTLELGLTIVTSPSGLPAHVDVTFSIATLGGPWQDSTGAAGTLVFNPALPAAGSPRPVPIPMTDSARLVDGSVSAVDVNPAQVQLRVTGACGAGQFLRNIDADGTVQCGSDAGGAGTITGVVAGAGLLGGGSSGPVSLNVAFGGPGGVDTAARSDHTHQSGTGGTNTVVGLQAFSGAGGFNTAVGFEAMQNLTGVSNTALGAQALRTMTGGVGNTAVGTGALSNATASSNTAVGWGAMLATTTGTGNVALGDSALSLNTTGDENTAVGSNALAGGTGIWNTAVGASTLRLTTGGIGNTAVGHHALAAATGGNDNTAVGRGALELLEDGDESTAVGVFALAKSTAASPNTAVGGYTLYNNLTGTLNTAIGHGALSNSTGTGNIALGHNAGGALVTGNGNVYIGHIGIATESNITRLGSSQAAAFISGISGVNVAGAGVMVNANGQLGVTVSSARFKERITGLGDVRAQVQALRPVTFLYKPAFDDGKRQTQYGLIAEEVETVMPDLVVRDEQGQVQTVRYHVLPTLLLAEVQRLERERADMRRTYDAALDALRDELAQVRAALERR